MYQYHMPCYNSELEPESQQIKQNIDPDLLASLTGHRSHLFIRHFDQAHFFLWKFQGIREGISW
jgi:hypothetical protein